MVSNPDRIKWLKNHYKERYKKMGIKIDIFIFSILFIISIILFSFSSINILVPIIMVPFLIFLKLRWDKKVQLNCPLKVGFSKKGLFLNYESESKRILWEDVKDIEIDNDLPLKMHVIKFNNGKEYPLIYLTNDLIIQILEHYKNYNLS
jgi:hypothetical protein